MDFIVAVQVIGHAIFVQSACSENHATAASYGYQSPVQELAHYTWSFLVHCLTRFWIQRKTKVGYFSLFRRRIPSVAIVWIIHCPENYPVTLFISNLLFYLGICSSYLMNSHEYEAVWLDTCFFASCGLAWSATSGSVSAIRLIGRLVFCFELGLIRGAQIRQDPAMTGIRTMASPTLSLSLSRSPQINRLVM